jgi:cytidine deaminase
MRIIKKELSLISVSDISELSVVDANLLLKAKAALKDAYAPYSSFLVGCAILLVNGEIVIGNNQENAAYPSGLCAERVAIFYAGAAYPGVPIIAMAITAKSSSQILSKPVMSCGACLQSIAEYEHRYQQTIRTILQGETGDIYIAEAGTQTFLPFQFSANEL